MILESIQSTAFAVLAINILILVGCFVAVRLLERVQTFSSSDSVLLRLLQLTTVAAGLFSCWRIYLACVVLYHVYRRPELAIWNYFFGS